MNNNPLISVIVPTYNRENRVINTIESIVNQTYKNLEIIVVDDGSKDNTQQVVENYLKKTGVTNLRFIRQANAGAPAARNHGFSLSNGTYIVFFDSDDLMLEERIEKQITAILKEGTQCSGCGFYYNRVTGDKYLPPVVNNNLLELFVKRELRGSTQSWMYHRELISKVNGFDEKLKCFQDADLFSRVVMLNPKVSIVQEPLSIFITHEGEERIMHVWKNIEGLESIDRYYWKIINFLIETDRTSFLKSVTSRFASSITGGYLKLGKYQELMDILRFFFRTTKPLSFTKRLYHTSSFVLYTGMYTMKYIVKGS